MVVAAYRGRASGGKDDVQATADAVRISVLGPLEVTDPAGRPVRVGGHRVRALLILLALDAGRVVPAHALIGRLWGESRPSDAANALQSLVSRLRVALRRAGVPDGVLESSPAGYRLAVQPHAVDAIAFESQARAGRQALARGDVHEAAALLRAATGAWRGSALTDVAGEDFAFAPAARLAELHSAATLDRIEADLALGAADAALVGELRELAAADELAERPAALLMRALAATGRQAEALTRYQQVRDRLADRLGVDPSPQLEQAYLAVLRQEIPQAAAPRAENHKRTTERELAQASATARIAADAGPRTAAEPPGTGVRRPPTSFVGRDDDLAGLLERLAVERLVTLTGPGGVGKTRLAAEAAVRLDAPVWFAELAPVTDPAEVPYAVLDALGLRERSIARHARDTVGDIGGDAAGRLCAFLADRDAVLILDNCEHVIDAAATLTARLLADCPRVRVLATSHEALRIPGEVLQVVAPLATPGENDLPVISSAYAAVRLFKDRAAAVLDGFELTEGNAEAVARICRVLDGMPLAIELAAPWLRTLTPAALAERLDDRFALLASGNRTALPRHQTLRAVVDWSWNLLSAQERALACRLAVFPAGATLAAAEQVCAGQPPGLTAGPVLTAGTVLPTLAGLVGKSILARTETGDDGEARYRMLDTVRAYCLERLAEAGEDTAVTDAVARYYLDLVETADPLLRTSTQARWFRVLTAEQDNISAAIRWVTAAGDAASALRFVRSLGYYWAQRGHGESEALCRGVLTMDPPPLTRELAEARVICALLAAGWMWDIDSIRGPLTEALAAADEFDDGSGTCHPLVAMAEPVLLQYDGASDRARAQFERYADSPDPWLRAVGQAYLSSYDFSLGALDGAEEHCRAGLAELRGLGERWGVSMALTQLAEFTELRADHAASIEALTEAAAIGRELAAWGDLTYVEARLALIRARDGDLATAGAEMARVERMVAARGGHMDIDRWTALMRAELAWREGDYAESARCAAAVLAMVVEAQASWWQSLRAQATVRLAAALLKQGDQEQCGDLLGEALDAAAAWTEHPALAAVLDACAAYLLARGRGGDPERAAGLLGAAHAIRGAFDESSPDAPPARDAARAALGAPAYLDAYASSRNLGYEQAVALARAALAAR
jgi:predicted ATPase/DNA-binding SARP family transcriptional activator